MEPQMNSEMPSASVSSPKVGLIALAVLILIAGGVVGYVLGNGGSEPVVIQTTSPTAIAVQSECDLINDSRVSVINNFADTWSGFEKSIQLRPVLGSTVWSAPNDYQFIGNHRMLIAFEDGHVVVAAVIQYSCDNNGARDFSSLEFFNANYPFSEVTWNNVRNQYGDNKYPIHSYTKQIFRNGSIVNYDTWTEVSENIFVK